MTRSWDDERISRLVERAGLEGYGFYFRLVEIIAANMEENSEPNATYSAQKWSKLTAIFKPKVQKLCEVCSNLGLIELEVNSDLLKVTIPKIIKYRDEYSVKQGRRKAKSPDTVRTLSGATPEQEQIQIQKQIEIQKQNISSDEEKTKKKKVAGNKSPKLNAWGIWVDINRARNRADPIPTGADAKAAKMLINHIKDLQTIKDVMGLFLDDDDQYLQRNGHALRLISGRINAYINQAENLFSVPADDEALAAIMKIEDEVAAEEHAKHEKQSGNISRPTGAN